MKTRFLKLWDSLRTSYWFLPSGMALGSVLLMLLLLRIDRGEQHDWLEESGWIYSGGPEGAREVLSTIAGSMITVAGVTFSITIVALSLASQQFGPRLLYNFMRDRGNQVVLGTFISTFLYCLLVLRTIYGEGDGVDAFVPHLATTVGVVLAAASLGVLIYFIHHVAIAIQAPNVIAGVTLELHRAIGAQEKHSAGRAPTPAELEDLERELSGLLVLDSRPVPSSGEGYVQGIDYHSLFSVARKHDVLIRLPFRPGLFVLAGEPIAHVAPAEGLPQEVGEEIVDAIVLGSRRTAIQDIEFSVDQLSEVAVRALSTGINDPYTAGTCLDHLGAGLAHLMKEGLPSRFRVDDDGRPRILHERPLTFAGVADAAFNPIRQHAGESASVYIRMLDTIFALVPHARDEEALGTLKHHAIMVRRAGLERMAEEWDRNDLQGRFDAIAEALVTRPAAELSA